MNTKKLAFLLLLLAFTFDSCRKKNTPVVNKTPPKSNPVTPPAYPEQKPDVRQTEPVTEKELEEKAAEPIKNFDKFVEPKREFRAAWIATIANIDWPSSKGLDAQSQREEFISLLDHHKYLGINAVLVQIRAASDAFYSRSDEPWSEWLMGTQGVSPAPYYDPMVFMIEECHKRNMEFHAWFNLNRGKHKFSTTVTDNHITKRKPEWFMKYDGYELYDFGVPGVREYITEVVMNVVKKYDIDGVHFDDYFYPYKITGVEIPDQATFRIHGQGFDNVGDWRRHNIDLIIKGLSEQIKQEKKWVKFGVSPFCVWRNKSSDPKGSETQGGQPSYDFLFADTKKWAEYGWIDYIAPQIYFTFEFDKVPYDVMAKWWIENKGKSLLYIGHGIYRVEENSKSIGWDDPSQIPRQLEFNRYNKGVAGSIFYNTNTLVKNNLGVRDKIKKHYNTLALQPEMLWKDNVPPIGPSQIVVRSVGDIGLAVNWQSSEKAKDGDLPWDYAIYRFPSIEKMNLENPKYLVGVVHNDGTNAFIDKKAKQNRNYFYVVTALDRLHNESTPSNPYEWKPQP